MLQNWEQLQKDVKWETNIELSVAVGAVCHHRKLLCRKKDMYVVTILAALVLLSFVYAFAFNVAWQCLPLINSYLVIFSLTL